MPEIQFENIIQHAKTFKSRANRNQPNDRKMFSKFC